MDEYDSFGNQLIKLILKQQDLFESNEPKSGHVNYLKIIRKLYKKGKFRLADDAASFRPEKHDGLIYYDCLCLRRKSLEKRLHKVSTDIKVNDVIKVLNDKHALKLVEDKRTVKISTLDESVGAIRFYAIWLHMLE